MATGVGTELDFNSSVEGFPTVGKHADTVIRVVAVLRVPLKITCVRTSITFHAWTCSFVSHQYDFRTFWKTCEAV